MRMNIFPTARFEGIPFLLCFLLVIQVGCGSVASDQSSYFVEPNNRALRPMAEYEPARAVFFGTSSMRTMANSYEAGSANRAHLSHRVLELKNLILSMSAVLPKLQFFLHSSSEQAEDALGFNELEAWAEDLKASAAPGSAQIELFEFKAQDYPQVDPNRRFEDQWTRDYGPIAFKGSRGVEFGRRSTRGTLTSEYLADRLNSKLFTIDTHLEGGNFMSTRAVFVPWLEEMK